MSGRRTITPVNQKVLTNVAVVRYKTHGIRYEIACFPNKVADWRNGAEKDIEEVLQADMVYSNVSKGVFAKDADLKKGFGTSDHFEVAKIILQKGELQVSAKERAHGQDAMLKEIASIVSAQTINPETGLPYPTTVVLREMANIHYNVKTGKPAKAQAADVIRQLQERIPIEKNLFDGAL
ncbi:Ribosome maturation protein SBDS [Carpediemonas membranifera]|uniref:Ribosome maturation protein SBDS n=1 Tax=Carpediemonas membranifera TaxID=201153 RepID=A0A8J6E4T5_9EUKA|nr:Ribosome maturation protein SBDS [Carpediemonas membranifera]|eukprot:KAG9397331.1 Ribosome maturation protein SBDS [Carpediemonas membranifera]